VTPLGGLIVLIVVISVGILLAGPHSMQAPALGVGVLGLTAIVFGASGVASRGGYRSRSLSQRRVEFRGVDRDAKLSQEPSEADDAAWTRERERRERDGRS
jgi:hypothetical protein